MSEKISAAESIARTLARVKAVGKDSKNQQQGFNYRGIDAVVNAVHPVLAEVGGFIVGEVIEQSSDTFTSAKGVQGTWVRLRVKYSWHGTDGGDPVTGVVSSEANDFADKATAKAWSVALRTFLLQTLLLPTDDPDPDQSYIEGAAQNSRAPRAPEGPAREDVERAIADLSNAQDLSGLQEAWERAAQTGATRDPEVVKVKDDMKAVLS